MNIDVIKDSLEDVKTIIVSHNLVLKEKSIVPIMYSVMAERFGYENVVCER